MTRIKLIKEVGNFLTCQNCRFTYLPMNMLAEIHCPKCEPKIFESDSEYLGSEAKTIEQVSSEELFNDFPKREY